MVFNGLQGRFEKEYSLCKLTTWQIGGPAEYCFWPANQKDFLNGVIQAVNAEIPLHIIGKGSNLLAADEGVRGLIIVTTGLKRIIWSDLSLRVESGYLLNRLSLEAGQKGWSGLEFACGIPGTIGGAVRMNAGAYGRKIADCLRNITVWHRDLGIKTFDQEDLIFGYRSCSLPADAWILEAELSLTQGDAEEIRHRIKENLIKRKTSQPLELPNAGSVFRNPEGDSAGRLIEAAGWKGKSVGGAMVSVKHANFIVNTGGASAQDVIRLITIIQEDIEEKFNIRLTTEIRMI